MVKFQLLKIKLLKMKKIYFLLLLFPFLGTKSGFGQNTQEPETICLQVLANVSGHDLYTSFVHLGSLADAYMYKAYTQNFALKLLNEYIDYISLMPGELQKLIDNKLVTGNDVLFVKLQINAYFQLKNEAGEFKKYVETGESKYVESYENARRLAWKNIADILGLPSDVDPGKDSGKKK